MHSYENYETPEMEITIFDDNILTDIGAVSGPGGGGQSGFGNPDAQMYIDGLN